MKKKEITQKAVKKSYTMPQMAVVELRESDIICTSITALTDDNQYENLFDENE